MNRPEQNPQDSTLIKPDEQKTNKTPIPNTPETGRVEDDSSSPGQGGKPRRGNYVSSSSCENCKRKHTRCSEERPCENCKRLGVECMPASRKKRETTRVIPHTRVASLDGNIDPSVSMSPQSTSRPQGKMPLPKVMTPNRPVFSPKVSPAMKEVAQSIVKSQQKEIPKIPISKDITGKLPLPSTREVPRALPRLTPPLPLSKETLSNLEDKKIQQLNDFVTEQLKYTESIKKHNEFLAKMLQDLLVSNANKQ